VTDQRTNANAPSDDEAAANAADLPIEDVVELQGDARPEDQDAFLEPNEIEQERRPTQTELDHGYASPDRAYAVNSAEQLDGLDLDDLREGETDDPDAATEEGLAYVPPIDPPLYADAESEDGIVIAAGAAVSAESEPYDNSHRSSDLSVEGDLNDRIHAALRADAATSELADRLVVGTRGGKVVIRGVVDGIEDTDSIVEVVERVSGVTEVVDETELPD
jgi:hypothetical protein